MPPALIKDENSISTFCSVGDFQEKGGNLITHLETGNYFPLYKYYHLLELKVLW